MSDAHNSKSKSTSRTLVSRIDRSYFHRPNALARMRRLLVLISFIFGVGWCVGGAIDTAKHHAPGPVAHVHAKWENDCEACHVPYSPIKDNTWLTSQKSMQVLETKCQVCHRVGIHHPLQMSSETGSCASCHVDHRGREVDLNRTSDRSCTVCHAAIATHRKSDTSIATAPSPEISSITQFDDEHHPQFASLAVDPGRLKFSHGRHMLPGLSFGPLAFDENATDKPKDRVAISYGMLAEQDREKYQPKGSHSDEFVQLSCASCHEFVPSLPVGDIRAVSGLVASSPPGAYSLPVEFERHCAACHALPITGSDKPSASSLDTRGKDDIPHGLRAEAIRLYLEQTILQKAIQSDTTILDLKVPRSPLPSPQDQTIPDERLRTLISATVDASRTFVRGGCAKCHLVEDKELPFETSLLATDHPQKNSSSQSTWFSVGPVRVPAVWLRKAKFNHQVHRASDCRECHDAAYPNQIADIGGSLFPVGSPLDNQQVMIAGRHSCVRCHGPSKFDSATGTMIGGVRFDCVECHGYHGLGTHGLSSEAIESQSELFPAVRSHPIDDFLGSKKSLSDGSVPESFRSGSR